MNQIFYDFQATANDGSPFAMDRFRGKPVLVVNTASKCGFTPQYDALESLYRKYKDRGFTVIGFPCDQFAHQEPGGNAEIAEFCRLNFGVSFPLMAKTEVNGAGTHPVFRFLKSRTRGLFGASVKWNFTKFLVSPDGHAVKRFPPSMDPAKIAPDIERMLAE